jgi:hypothetical protein
MKRSLLLLCITMQWCGVALSRQQSNSTYHYLGYSLGLMQAKEENLIPKVHSGATHWLTYSLEKRGETYHRLDLRLGYGYLQTAIERDLGSPNEQLGIAYSYNFMVRQKVPVAYYVGPRVAYTSSLTEYQTWDEAHAYWGTCLSLGLSAVSFVDLQPGKFLAVNVDLSLLTFVSRPELHRLYANERWTLSNIVTIMNKDFRFGGWGRSVQARASAEYRLPFLGSSRLSFSPTFSYSKLRIDGGNALTEIIIAMGIGIWL